jgi:hypothetical protein
LRPDWISEAVFEVTEFSEVAASLSDRMSATLVRPDLLQPLLWPMTILMAGTVALALVGAPKGLTILFGIVLVINVVLYGVLHVGCLLTNPAALRTETITVGPAAPHEPEAGRSDEA